MNDELRLLLEFRTEALTAIRGSTACAAVQDALCAHVDRTLDAAAGRSAAALQRSLQHSAEVRAGILNAAGALVFVPGDRQAAKATLKRIARLGPQAFSLRRVPDIETIRAALLARLSEPKPAPADISAPQTTQHE